MILQASIPYDISKRRPLPGLSPCPISDWLIVDDAFAGQMAERTRLLTERRADVLALLPEGRAAADELLENVLATLGISDPVATRPDGVQVAVDRADPLGTLGHLVQEDFCVLDKQGDEHVLQGAVLCFPAGWRLREKLGRPLRTIHDPVAVYDDGVAKRVQRLFDGVQAGRPIWRFNLLPYRTPYLFQPFGKSQKSGAYLRSERQTLLRLPRTGAVVFGIHTYVVHRPRDPESETPNPGGGWATR